LAIKLKIELIKVVRKIEIMCVLVEHMGRGMTVGCARFRGDEDGRLCLCFATFEIVFLPSFRFSIYIVLCSNFMNLCFCIHTPNAVVYSFLIEKRFEACSTKALGLQTFKPFWCLFYINPLIRYVLLYTPLIKKNRPYKHGSRPSAPKPKPKDEPA